MGGFHAPCPPTLRQDAASQDIYTEPGPGPMHGPPSPHMAVPHERGALWPTDEPLCPPDTGCGFLKQRQHRRLWGFVCEKFVLKVFLKLFAPL